MTAGLVCQNVSFIRRRPDGSQKTILNDIHVIFFAGQTTVISGATGSGKTTLLHLLAGLMRPSEGQICADNQPISRWNTTHRDRWRQRVGIVFQHPHLLNELTVLENIMVPIVPRVNSLARLRRLAYKALDDLQISHLAGQKVFALSGGEQQRVSIARAIVSQPAILIADEPTTHQDDEGAAMILDNFTRWKAPNKTIVLAAHDSRIIQHEKFADKQYLMEDGGLKKSK
jgi:ABC-type lipoprotein export system ATPase subunit